MKTCKICNKTKPLTDFYKNKTYSDEYVSKCKTCSNDQTTKNYIKNKDEILAKNKEYRKANAHLIKVKKKQYRESNKGLINTSKKDYYYNKGGKEKAAEWRNNNKDKVKANEHNMRVKRRAKTNDAISAKDLSEWTNTQLKVCVYCNSHCESSYHIDHIEPLATNGVHALDNLAISCPSCNLSKNKKELIVWLASRN